MEDKIKKRAEEIGKEMTYPIMGEEVPNTMMSFGLTKLELFAAMAMQGLSGKVFEADIRHCDIISESVSFAKSLCFALAEAELKEVSNV